MPNKIGSKILNFSLRVLFTKLGLLKNKTEQISHSGLEDMISKEDYEQVTSMPRFKQGSTHFLGKPIVFSDNLAFMGMIDEIFLRNNYKFQGDRPDPYVIDCGANIGIATIFFKQQYPDAKVLAIEADPRICQILSDNIKSYGFTKTTAMNAAVWKENGEMVFSIDDSWGGHLGGDKGQKSVRVKSIDLNDLLNEPVDFLKLDIEGAENEVLIHSRELIVKNVKYLFFEWHSLSGEQQKLGEILSYYEKHGFRYHIREASEKKSPFLEKRADWRMDTQLDCFLYKA